MSEALGWPNPHEMEYSIQLCKSGHYWTVPISGDQVWYPLEAIIQYQAELAKPQWLHLGYRVIERRKAGPPRVVHPDQLKDAVRPENPELAGPFG